MQDSGGQELAARSPSGSTARSHLPDVSSVPSPSGLQKASPLTPRENAGAKLRASTDGGPYSQRLVGAVGPSPSERLPAYGGAAAERAGFASEATGSSREQRSGSRLTRPAMTATAATQVTFQDPIESERIFFQFLMRYFYCRSHICIFLHKLRHHARLQL